MIRFHNSKRTVKRYGLKRHGFERHGFERNGLVAQQCPTRKLGKL